MKRSEAREEAFKIIYSKIFNNSIDNEIEIDDKDALEFVTNILKSFATNYNEINQTISNNLKGYTIERLNKIDLSIIVLAIIELNYIKENPKEVIINEAVELAKKYSTEKSPKFINGFLAGIVK